MAPTDGIRFLPLGGGVTCAVSDVHAFGTDAVLLWDFCRAGERAAKPDRIAVDLCSGCGIVPLLFCRDARAKGLAISAAGIELQEDAAALFARSIAENALVGCAQAVHADIRDISSEDGVPMALHDFKGRCDLVTCNPPYTPMGHGAPAAGAARRMARQGETCTMGDVAAAAKMLLRFGGRLCICQRPERLCDLFAAMRDNGIEPKRVRFVAKRPDCAPWLVLVEGKRGGRPFLKVEPALFVQNEDGTPSDALQKCYEVRKD